MSAKVSIEMTVNGEAVEVSFAPHKTLLEVLREDLGLTGTKHGCELGECGACAVLVDGKPVLSCLVLGVACDGAEVTTVEGLAPTGPTLHPLQEAFADHGAAQCGYCTPGILVTADALLEQNPHPSRARDRGGALGQPVPLHRLSPDLRGRRGGGERTMAAGRRARRTRRDGARGLEPWPRHRAAPPRVDGRAKVTGQTRFADDLVAAAHAALQAAALAPAARPDRRRSTPRRAAARPGVRCVLTGEDFPIPYGILPVSQDEHAAVPRPRPLRRRPGRGGGRHRRGRGGGGALELIDVIYEPLRHHRLAREGARHPRAAASTTTARSATSTSWCSSSSATSTPRSPPRTRSSRTCSSTRATPTSPSSSTRRWPPSTPTASSWSGLQHADAALPAPRAGQGARPAARRTSA